jgi:DNA polymerase III subunit delta
VIHLYFGPDTLSRSEAVNALKRSWDSDGMLESNTTTLDGAVISPDELRNHCNTVPFLAAKRLIVVDGLIKRTERRRRGGGADAAETGEDDSAGKSSAEGLPAWRFLRDFATEMPQTNELVLIDADVSPGNQFVRDMKPVAEIREFRLPGRNELPDWILTRAEQRGLEISGRLASQIAEAAGPDLWALDNELEKIATCAAGGTPLTDAELLAMMTVSREQSVFAFCDQVAEGRKAPALSSLARLLGAGESPQYLLSMITRQFRLIALAREGIDERLTPAEVMDRLDTRSQYVVDKTTQQARRFSMPLLRKCFQRMVKADLDTKTGIFDGEMAIQLLVADLAGAAAR